MLKKPFACIILALVVLDQVTKYLVTANLFPGQTLAVTSFFRLTYATNTGVAFSMFQGNNTFFIVFTALVLAGLAFFYRKHRESFTPVIRAALLLIVAGALGNLADRMVHGHVIDFLEFHVRNYYWPAFNVADSCITIGGTLLFWSLWRPGTAGDASAQRLV